MLLLVNQTLNILMLLDTKKALAFLKNMGHSLRCYLLLVAFFNMLMFYLLLLMQPEQRVQQVVDLAEVCMEALGLPDLQPLMLRVVLPVVWMM
jgi:hypothetical protein